MKIRIITGLALLLALCATPAAAQRNLPGEKSVRLSAGWVDGMTFKDGARQHRVHASLGYMVTVKNHRKWLFAANYLQKDYLYLGQVVPKSQYTGEAGFFVPVFSDRKRYVAINAGLSALAGYETSNKGDKLLPDGATLRNKDCFLYGGAITAEVETYLTDWAVFHVHIRQNLLFGSSIGKWHTLVGFGFRFVIN